MGTAETVGIGGVLILVMGVVGSLGATIATYNRLVVLSNRCKNDFSQVDVQLKRRYELIPNLVKTAQGYMAHEHETLKAVTRARAAAVAANGLASGSPGDPEAMRDLSAAELRLGDALGRLMTVIESYPTLQANRNMMAIQEELASTENRVAFARQAYNDAVTSYNTDREVFPRNVVANRFGFAAVALFEVDNKAERQAPEVSFS